MAKLGYTSNISELDAFKAEIFDIIDQELDKCKADAMRVKGHGRK